MKFAVNPYFCVIFALAVCGGTRASEVVRTAAALRAMSPAEANEALPVEMEAVATFVDRSKGMLFAHDGVNGFYVDAQDLIKKSDWLAAGRKLRVRGDQCWSFPSRSGCDGFDRPR
jgi:hypothetical protein